MTSARAGGPTAEQTDVGIVEEEIPVNGTIKKLVSDRGFGFILPEGANPNGEDLFFHRSDVRGAGYDALREGEQVTYDLGRDDRRGTEKATNVQAS